MTAGTRQYQSSSGATGVGNVGKTVGDEDFTVTAATDKYQYWDCGGANREVDIIMSTTDGVTVGFAELWIANESDGAETITLADGNNSDNVFGTIEQHFRAHLVWDGTSWSASTGAT